MGTTPETEIEFTRIWKGVGKNIDMGAVMRRKTKQTQRDEFREQLESLPLPAKNLKNMKNANIDRLMSTALQGREAFLKKKVKAIERKQEKEILLTDLEKKRLREFQDLKRVKKGISKAKLKKGKAVQTAIKREQLVTQTFKSKKIKIKTVAPKKKGFKRRKAIKIFSRKMTVQGKTKKIKVFGSVSTDKGDFWVTSANLKTGKIRLRNKENGRFAKI